MSTHTYPEDGIYAEFFNKIHGFPIRNGITKTGMGDFGVYEKHPQEVENQHLRLLEALDVIEMHRLIPEHKDKIAVTFLNLSTLNFYNHADALISAPGGEEILLACPTADCPTLLATTANKDFATLIHCGYRPVKKGLVPQALNTLSLSYPAQEIMIGIFPGICGYCYEVGPEFTRGFFREYLSIDRKLNLKNVVIDQCIDSGIDAENIFVCDYCSYHSEEEGVPLYFSYRRNRTPQRNLVFAVI
jgi:copper oxidase (laccase) domain-containing protein